MKLQSEERRLPLAVLVLTAIVLVLAVLQYRWTNQVSEATGVRLADSLRMSMIGWHLDLFRNVAEVCLTMRVSPETVPGYDPNQYIRGYEEWRKAAVYPDLVANLYLAKSEGQKLELLRMNAAPKQFEPAQPLNFGRLQNQLAEQSSRLLLISESADEMVGSHAAAAMNLQLADHYYRVGDPLAGWQFEPTLPALVHPIIHHVGAADKYEARERAVDWIVIELNSDVLRTRVFADLAQRYFQGTEGLDYQLAVVAGNDSQHLLYSSDSQFGREKVLDADAIMDVFADSGDETASRLNLFRNTSGASTRDGFVGTSWFPLLHEGESDVNWRLVARHRGQSHGAFVGEMRRRDLTISFGVLLSLAISIAMVIASSNRAQRLANVQMEFVTTVSHELRTPLAVISSAADNLADGVVNGKQQLMEYGSVIKNQSRQLAGMVENILLFTATRNGQHHYSLSSLDIGAVVDSALANTATVLQTAGFRVDRDIPLNLPRIQGDRSALTQCIQNLITNAVKYGGDARWIGIRARIAENAANREIQVSISDKGIGISKADLQHIFEPFYRSPAVTSAQIHGTGLGLALAKSIAEAMKGSLTVHSTPAEGTTFTLHIPVTEEAATGTDTQAGAMVAPTSA